MSLTAKQYTLRLWDIRKSVAQKLGLDVTVADITTRASVLAGDVATAVILKLLVDKGVFTDAELSQAAAGVINATIPQLPAVVLPTEDGTPAPDPDLGA